MKQLTHDNTRFEKRTFPITLICDNVSNAANIGSLFRISDAFGVEKLILCGDHIPMGRKMTKTSRATEKRVNFELKANILKVIEEILKQDFELVILEIKEI